MESSEQQILASCLALGANAGQDEEIAPRFPTPDFLRAVADEELDAAYSLTLLGGGGRARDSLTNQ